MPSKFDLPDPELEQFARQREYAKMLRNKAFADTPSGEMVSGIYVPKNDNWGKFINAAVGGWNDARAQGGESALVGEREKQFSEFLRKRPDMMADKVVPGTPAVIGGPVGDGEGMLAPATGEQLPSKPATPDTVTRVMKPWQQQQREQADWAVSGAGIRHPLAQAMAMKGLTSGFDLAEGQVKSMVDSGQIFNVQVADDGTATGITKTGQTVNLGKIGKEKEQKAPTVKQLAVGKDMIQDQEFVDGKWVNRGDPYNRHNPRVGTGGAGGIGTLAQSKYVTDDNKPLTFSKVTGKYYYQNADGDSVEYNKTPKLASAIGGTAAEKKEGNAVRALLDMVTLAKTNLPNYSMVASVTPNMASQYFTDPSTKAALASVGRLSAKEAHELYGAAFTAAEQRRADRFLPSAGDLKETVAAKIAVMEVLLAKKLARMEGQPDPYPDGLVNYKGEQINTNSLLDSPTKPISAEKPSGSGASALPTANAAATGAKPNVKTVEDYNKLPKGTVYIDPNGLEKVKR